MVESDSRGEKEPILQPRLVRFLKDRPRLVDKGLRREFLEELEREMVERRKPDTVAERMARSTMDRFNQATGKVARKKASAVVNKANDGPLQGL